MISIPAQGATVLFPSFEFLFAFLPLTLAGYFLLGRVRPQAAPAWLAAASLYFYSSWQVEYLALIACSILLNHGGGSLLEHLRRSGRHTKPALIMLITINLGLLGYFKYLNFIVDSHNSIAEVPWVIDKIVLPIGISFFTFTQIAYLVDVSRDKVRERGFISYVLFVTYFPHLLAGPILHHAEVMPQFARRDNLRPDSLNLSRGLTFLTLGLFKKLVFADSCAPIADHAFSGASTLSFQEAWIGLLAYVLQIYFDFSGYTDMAIGISLMFNIRLPLNFNSPLKAANITDFWRSWHMTLSRLIRDYLYIPLGGNRKGHSREVVNLMTTMLIAGLWHGANWTFVIWGCLHGLYMVTYRLWRHLRPGGLGSGPVARMSGTLITFSAITFSFVLFRADSLAQAHAYLIALDPFGATLHWQPECWPILGLLIWIWVLPNSNAVMGYSPPSASSVQAPPDWLRWRPCWQHAVLVGIALFVAGLAGIAGGEPAPFIYFQF